MAMPMAAGMGIQTAVATARQMVAAKVMVMSVVHQVGAVMAAVRRPCRTRHQKLPPSHS
jgi:hypothetical protein